MNCLLVDKDDAELAVREANESIRTAVRKPADAFYQGYAEAYLRALTILKLGKVDVELTRLF